LQISSIFVLIQLYPSLYSDAWCVCSADQRRRRGSRVLQRSELFPDITGADEIRTRQVRPCECTDVPHQPGTAAGTVHRGQECLHRDKVSLTATAWRHRQSRDERRLCARGDQELLLLLLLLFLYFRYQGLKAKKIKTKPEWLVQNLFDHEDVMR